MTKPLGYYITCDDALCVNCLPGGWGYFGDGSDAQFPGWEGFEDWATPLSIFVESSSDTPTHCVECGDLIPHNLTAYGYGYVGEAILMHPEVIVCSYDQGVRRADDMLRVAILEMRAVSSDVADAVNMSDTEMCILEADGWCDSGEDAEALQWLMEAHEAALPDGFVSVWNGDCGIWSILDLRPETLGPVLAQWHDAYPDWQG